ncbi:hypothetical protein CCYN74_40175 [Capnocytophaga cynodegmi]|uniref:Uncharacterized protein n=1 Tax=Capnocytophaga cynodegmi TaxID=28189 RepID=A0A0B7HRF0_9FLAO|nr:hypothetical protein CCYN74_40175 [Capnocytophaga cynodegmi]
MIVIMKPYYHIFKELYNVIFFILFLFLSEKNNTFTRNFLKNIQK